MNPKGLPTPSVSVNASVAACIGIHCDAWESITLPPQFPSVTMYANTSGNASVDADARCGYNLIRAWLTLSNSSNSTKKHFILKKNKQLDCS